MESALQHHWQQLSLATQPPPQRGSSLVFDQKRQQTVLVADGGTWQWDGTNWREAQSQSAPPARNTTHLVYDSTTECVLLFGGVGIDGTPLNDVWLWNGTLWIEQHPATFPSPVGGASMACDASRQQVILFGGLMGFDGVNGSNRVGTFSDQTWIWDGTTWTEQTISNPPPARMGGQMIYDQARQQVLLFGGNGPSGYLNDMWLWHGDGWEKLAPGALPPMQTRTYATFHAQLQQVLLLTDVPAETFQAQHTYQSWLWDGTSWSQSTASKVLPGSIEGLAYDGMHQTVVAYVVTGSKAPLSDKSSGARLPEIAAPTLASETWIW